MARGLLREGVVPARRSPSLALSLLAIACNPGFEQLGVGQQTQAMSVCADGPTVFGIDVSRFQGAIEWPKVADAGVVYAWIQISRSLTDIDPRFEENWQGAKDAGILRGAYQRFQPDEDVAGQAQLFLDKLGPYQAGDLPPMLDVEDSGGLGPGAIAAAVQQWLDIVEPAVGVTPIIYTGYYFWRDEVGGPDFTRYPLWVPNYSADCPLVPPQWSRWTLHQYSSSATIPGITANTVDVNRFNGTLEELQALAAPPECGDGACTGGESSDSCLEDCPPCQVIGAAGDVVEDSSECFGAGGDPQFIRHENAGHGGSLQWTHATDLPQPANYGRWDLYFEEAGRYRIEAYTPAPYNQSRRAVYRVTHGGDETAVEADQTAVDGWNLIGELDFAAGGGQRIRLDDNTGEPNDTETKIAFDAIRLTRLDAAGDGDRDGGTTGEDRDGDLMGGCGVAGGGAPGAWLLVLLALLGRRPRRRGEERAPPP